MRLHLHTHTGRDSTGLRDPWESLSAPFIHTLYIAEERRGGIVREHMWEFTPITESWTENPTMQHVGNTVYYDRDKHPVVNSFTESDAGWWTQNESMPFPTEQLAWRKWVTDLRVTQEELAVRQVERRVSEWLHISRQWESFRANDDAERMATLEQEIDTIVYNHLRLGCYDWHDAVRTVREVWART